MDHKELLINILFSKTKVLAPLFQTQLNEVTYEITPQISFKHN